MVKQVQVSPKGVGFALSIDVPNNSHKIQPKQIKLDIVILISTSLTWTGVNRSFPFASCWLIPRSRLPYQQFRKVCVGHS